MTYLILPAAAFLAALALTLRAALKPVEVHE